MATTDAFQFNKSELFAQIRAGLSEISGQETQNLLETSNDDLLFAWDVKNSCLLAVNWRAAHVKGLKDIKYQTLIPSVPESFQVERILSSVEGTYIALSGTRGVTILEVPPRYGENGLFHKGRSRVTCRTTNLDAQLFSNNPHLEVRQIRWHPDSATDSHLLVLLSDNTIRVYDNTTLRRVWQVGPLPMKNDNSLPSALTLGELAVDFDIAPPVKANERSPNDTKNDLEITNLSVSGKKEDSRSLAQRGKIEWPIVILRENGNLYVLMAGMDTDKPRLQGPITITPQVPDNFGLESCSILIIPSVPPTLVIAESCGKLHHALFLEAETPENSFNEVDSTLVIHPSEWTAHVLETVELELGLPKQDKNDRKYNCAIHLKRDFINETRYFAYHNTGLHVVTLNFINELERFLENEVLSDITTISTPSRAEYLVCTKIDASEKVNPILGFVLLQLPAGVVLLLGSGEVVSLKLIIDPKALTDYQRTGNKKTENDEDKNALALAIDDTSFIDHIKNMLKRTVTQPILSVDKTCTPAPQELYELLMQSIAVLRKEYISRHEAVRKEITKRTKTIKLRAEQQLLDIEELENEKKVLRENAHHLAEKIEEQNDGQVIFLKKYRDLIYQANTRLPSNPLAAREFQREVEKINKTTKNLISSVDKIRDSIPKQSYQISKFIETNKDKSFELPEKQEKTIKDILLQMHAEIDNQIKELKRLNKIVGQ